VTEHRGEKSRWSFMMDSGGMMWGMGIGHVLVIVLLVLLIAALVKYVFFR
jgi:hypothetical protein